MSLPKISKLDQLPRFERTFKRLNLRIQKEVKEAVADILKNPIPNDRHVHKMGGYKDI